MLDRVEESKVVFMHYSVYGEDGSLIESTVGGEPLGYLHGRGNIVAGLEKALEGHGIGDTVKVTLVPEDAYGARKGTGAQAVPRKELLALLRDQHQGDKVELRVGMPVAVPDSKGERHVLWVTRLQGARAWVDVDHPMAGRTLTFECVVLFVRDPYPEELAHGHAHT